MVGIIYIYIYISRLYVKDINPENILCKLKKLPLPFFPSKDQGNPVLVWISRLPSPLYLLEKFGKLL